MPSLHHAERFDQRDQTKTDIHLTVDTVPVLAKAQIKSGQFREFAALADAVSQKSELLKTIKPALVKQAAEALATQKLWGTLVQLVCAVQTEPKMLATIKPEMVKSAAVWLLTPDEGHSNTKAYGLNGLKDYSELALAVTTQKSLRAVLNKEDIAKVSNELADHFSHTYDANHGRREPRMTTIYYPESVQAFHTLSLAVKSDARLAEGIAPKDLAKAIETFWGIGAEKTNEYQTDQGYGTEVPKGFTGFNPLGVFIESMGDAPASWKEAIADQICVQVGKGMHDRIGPFTTKIIKKHEWVMDVPRFTAALNVQPNSDCKRYMLFAFSDCDRLKPAYPAGIRTWLAGELHDRGEIYLHENILKQLGPEVVTSMAEIATKMAEDKDYGALSRFLHSHQPGIVRPAMLEILASHDLYMLELNGYDREDNELQAVIGRRPALDIIFRKATGDAVVCAETISEFGGGYTYGARPPRDVVAPASDVKTLLDTAPADMVPIISLGFARAANGKNSPPEWVQTLASNMQAASLTP